MFYLENNLENIIIWFQIFAATSLRYSTYFARCYSQYNILA